jgi:cyclophilin family peptidyl-prolyl cis-trans isomerase
MRRGHLKPLFLSLSLTLLLSIPACKKEKDCCGPPAPEPAETVAIIQTSFGDMYVWLNRQTPQHRENFLKLAREGFFNGSTFHRVVPGFVIQGGDPNSKDSIATNDGSGGPGYTIPAEFVDSLKHVYGAVGAARDNNPQKASNGSQYYIVVDPNGEPGLNTQYTVFGRVFSGMDVAVNISKQSRDARDRPRANIPMQVKVQEISISRLQAEFGFTPDSYR